AEWIANRRDADLVLVLEEALARRDLRSALAVLAPAQPEYQRLRMALAQLREAQAAGGWEGIDGGPTLREGEASPRVAQVRRRLMASTDGAERRLAAAPDSLTESFTGELSEAVRSFQHRHGLDEDGAVGARTLDALNVPVEVRIQQVIANLERWRWLPHDLGARHIRVNIAAFETEVWDEGRVAMRLRSIVGRQYRMTPSFTASMRYLVVAPYWHVPPNIAALDKLPEIKRDVGYLARQRFTLLDQRTNDVVDPATVDWPAMTGSEFNRRYRLRQDPGPLNALGNVKFMFPNRHHVYLHDTPQRELFQRTQRDFSSGCIRIEDPMALAAFLLSGDPAWSPATLQAAVAQGTERTIFLPEPIPVHLLYMTAFVDPEGHVHFRSDLYGRDGMVLNALAGDPPAP
ncbi:MAG TPA: L,D-transpeptidase family protein, partial [Longimicrobiales bacterium]|nr:L,D-transpeptidase family protein [Longimicrobiales bacterium]